MAKEDLKNKDWESILDEDAYQVTRCFATEAPYSGKFLDNKSCLLYTSPSPRDLSTSRMPSSA